MKHTIEKLITTITKQLEPEYHDPILAQQTAWWLLEALTKQKQSQLIVQQELELSPKQQEQLDHWITELTTLHKPLQYILGSVPFADTEIMVRPPILIPRPETEEWVIQLMHEFMQLRNQQLTILDIGTGSGCIAIALAKALPYAKITATDIDPQALDLACTNAHHNHVNNIEFIESDVYASLSMHDSYDLIVSNPPYIAQEEWKNLDLSVTQWENPHALLAMHEGLAVIEKIIAEAPKHLAKDSELHIEHLPRLVIEIGHTQGPTVKKIMEYNGFHHVEIKKDLEGKDRTVWGRL